MKNNYNLIIALALGVYAMFVFNSDGVSVKFLVAGGFCAYLLLQQYAPAMAVKVKEAVKKLFNRAVDKGKDIVDDAKDGSLFDKEGVVGKPVLLEAKLESFTPEEPEHRAYFKVSDNDAIGHLAYEAKLNGNITAVEQLKAVHGEFFNIALKRVDDDVKKEETNEDKPTA